MKSGIHSLPIWCSKKEDGANLVSCKLSNFRVQIYEPEKEQSAVKYITAIKWCSFVPTGRFCWLLVGYKLQILSIFWTITSEKSYAFIDRFILNSSFILWSVSSLMNSLANSVSSPLLSDYIFCLATVQPAIDVMKGGRAEKLSHTDFY